MSGGDVTDDSVYDDGLVQCIFGNLAAPVVTLDTVAAAKIVDLTSMFSSRPTFRVSDTVE